LERLASKVEKALLAARRADAGYFLPRFFAVFRPVFRVPDFFGLDFKTDFLRERTDFLADFDARAGPAFFFAFGLAATGAGDMCGIPSRPCERSEWIRLRTMCSPLWALS
jgi:hypothetical protein